MTGTAGMVLSTDKHSDFHTLVFLTANEAAHLLTLNQIILKVAQAKETRDD